MSFNKCFVPGCITECNVDSKSNKIAPQNNRALFKTPNTKTLFEKWKRNIPRGGIELLPGCLVCEIHFPEESIIRYIKTTMLDGAVCMVKRSKPILKPDAVPTIFPNLPPHLYRTLKKVTPPRIGIKSKQQKKPYLETFDSSSSKGSLELVLNSSDYQNVSGSNSIIHDSEVSSSVNDSVIKVTTDMSISATENNVSSTEDCLLQNYSSSSAVRPIELPIAKSTLNLSCQSNNFNCKGSNDLSAVSSKNIIAHETIHKQKRSLAVCSSPDSTDNFQIIIAEGENCDSLNNNEILTFRNLKENIEDVKVPSWRWSCSFLRNSIAFLDWGPNFEIRKKVIVNYDMKYKTFIMGKEISVKGFEEPKSFQDLQHFLQIVDKIVTCQGIEREAKQRSKNCYGFVPPREEGRKKCAKKRCDECLQEMKNIPILQKIPEEKQHKRVLRLSTALSTERMKNRGLALMIQKLRQRIEKLSNEDISEASSQLEKSKNVEEILVDGIRPDDEMNQVIEETIVNMDDEMFIA